MTTLRERVARAMCESTRDFFIRFDSLSEDNKEIALERADSALRCLELNEKPLHEALVQIFGAEPDKIVLSSRDHLSITADMRELCMVAGGPWAKLVTDLDARIAERQTYKDPGVRPPEITQERRND